MNEKGFLVDFHAGQNAAEAVQLKWWILRYIDQKKLVTADEIYKDSRCGDIAMYLALHELVTNNLIEGLSPYDDQSKGRNHHQMQFRRAKNNEAMFFSAAAEEKAEEWDPDKWNVEDICTCCGKPLDPNHPTSSACAARHEAKDCLCFKVKCRRCGKAAKRIGDSNIICPQCGMIKENC
jgi:hypothetical protein